MVDVIVIFSYFLLSLQLRTDLLFKEKVPVPFFFMSHEPTQLWMCFFVSLNLLKCETLYFVQCIFNLYFFLIVVPYEAPLYYHLM